MQNKMTWLCAELLRTTSGQMRFPSSESPLHFHYRRAHGWCRANDIFEILSRSELRWFNPLFVISLSDVKTDFFKEVIFTMLRKNISANTRKQMDLFKTLVI